jgi:hypothetical protein
MQLTAGKAREITRKSREDAASLIVGKITAACVGNGRMPRRYVFTPCNRPAAKALRAAGFGVCRLGPFALVRW